MVDVLLGVVVGSGYGFLTQRYATCSYVLFTDTYLQGGGVWMKEPQQATGWFSDLQCLQLFTQLGYRTF